MSNQQNILRLLRKVRPHDATVPKIRIGSLRDGGYVINDDLEGVDGVISIGVGHEVSFDFALAQMGIPVFQYDPTVDGPPLRHDLFKFHKLGWARDDGETTRSLGTMVAQTGIPAASNDLLLKFDVENAEWAALAGVDPELLRRFRVITCELHSFIRLGEDHIFEAMWRGLSLLTRHHVVTHVHPNNYGTTRLVHGISLTDAFELSFLRRDRATFVPSLAPIPSPLDYPNDPKTADIVYSGFGWA